MELLISDSQLFWQASTSSSSVMQMYITAVLQSARIIHTFTCRVYEAGGPGSLLARSACHRKVEFCHCVIDSFPPVLTTGSKKAVHVLLCLCNK